MKIDKSQLKQLQQYVDYLNAYLGNCPTNLLNGLIEEEIAHLRRQQNLMMNYRSGEIEILYYINHLKCQQLNAENESEQPNIDKRSQEFARVKAERYLTLINKVRSHFLPGYQLTFPFDKASIDKEYNELVLRDYTAEVYGVLIDVLNCLATSMHFTVIDLKKIKQHARVNCINRHLRRDVIRQLDTMILVQRYASLGQSDINRNEKGALNKILDESIKHSIGPHLTHSNTLTSIFQIADKRPYLELTLDKGHVLKEENSYWVVLKPDEVTEKEGRFFIIFEENILKGIYSRTQLIFDQNRVRLDEGKFMLRLPLIKVTEADEGTFKIKIEAEYLNEMDDPSITICFNDFLDQIKLTTFKAGNELRQENEQWVYMNSVACKIDEDDYLLRDYTHTGDNEFELFSKEAKAALHHAERKPFLYESIDDRSHILRNAMDGTNHRYLPLASYYLPTEPFHMDSRRFLSQELALFKMAMDAFSSDEAFHEMPLVLEGISVEGEEEKKLNITTALDRPCMLKKAMHAFLEGSKLAMPKTQRDKLSPVESARQKGYRTLESYLSRREVERLLINEALAIQMIRVNRIVQTLIERPDALTEAQLTFSHSIKKQVDFLIAQADYFSTRPSAEAYQQIQILNELLVQLTQQPHTANFVPAIQSHLKILSEIMSVLFDLDKQQSEHLSVTALKAYDMLLSIESFSPTWSERNRLLNLREILTGIRPAVCEKGRVTTVKHTLMMSAQRGLHRFGRMFTATKVTRTLLEMCEEESSHSSSATKVAAHT